MKINGKKKVTLNYTVKDESMNVVDQGDNVKFIIGVGSLLPQFEKNLEGLDVSDEKEFVLEPAQAYGEYNLAYIQKVPLKNFNENERAMLKVGKTLQMYTPEGTPMIAKVKEITDTDVTFDFNHPLAGKKLTFNVKILNVEEPTKGEIEHGHVHDSEHHHHEE